MTESPAQSRTSKDWQAQVRSQKQLIEAETKKKGARGKRKEKANDTMAQRQRLRRRDSRD
jgi:hypothetical protein